MPSNENRTDNAMYIVRSLLQIGSELHRNGNRIAGEYGLNQQQFVVLSEIAESGRIMQKQLVGGLVIEKSNVSKIIKKLRALGLVEVSPSPEDGRAAILNTTEKGKSVWRECMDKFNAWSIGWIASLTEDDIIQTIQGLERLKGLPL